MYISGRDSFLFLSMENWTMGGRQNEVFDALFCLINLASVCSQFLGVFLLVWKDL
jgi:hypothetical protein